ncbi:MAG: hypothetical protein JWM09_154 [Francisellaceae bacterium]|nr:hypothetical protein [Francisellaceae bacterium]
MNKMINCVVGIIKNKENQFLIAKRPAHKDYSEYWEFPGGKIEKEESDIQALQRELFEEVGVNVLKAVFLREVVYTYPEYTVNLNVYVVENFENEAFSKEDQEILWVDFESLSYFKFLPPTPPMLNSLKEYLTFNECYELKE